MASHNATPSFQRQLLESQLDSSVLIPRYGIFAEHNCCAERADPEYARVLYIAATSGKRFDVEH